MDLTCSSFLQVVPKSIFEVLPSEIMFEILTSLSADDVTNMVTSCSAAANTFVSDKRWFFDWMDRCCGTLDALMTSVQKEDLVALRRLLARMPEGFDVNSVLENLGPDITLLSYAAGVGHMPSLNELLYGGWGADVHGSNALHMAVLNERVLAIAALLNHPDIDPNVLDAGDRTALHIACMKKNAILAALIVQHPQADVNALDGDGCTPLRAAVLAGAGPELLELMVHHPRVDVNAQSWVDGTTVLHISARAACLEDLLVFVKEPRFDLNIQDVDGRTALHHIGMVDREDKAADVFKCAQLLLSNPLVANNVQDHDGFTPLHMFAMINHVDVVRAMMHTPGVNLAAVSIWGDTAREYARKCSSTEVYGLLGSVTVA